MKKTRIEQMQRAERARKILSAIKWRIIELQILPNNEMMSNKLFRFALKESEDLNLKFETLQKRKFKIERFIWKNAKTKTMNFEFKGTKGEWKTGFRKPPFSLFVNGDWFIKADNYTETPIACIPEPIGGKKNDDGISSVQKANAKLIAAAPELLEALQKLVDANINNQGESVMRVIDNAQKAIEKALK